MVSEISSATERFFAFLPHNILKNQNFEKMKKTPQDTTILHMCTINHNHMMYVTWDIKCDRYYFLSFWSIFCPFTPLTAQKIKILKKWKKFMETSSFYISVPKITIRRCTVPQIWCVTDVIIFHFGPFFTLLPPNSPKYQNFKKRIKHLEISSLYICVPKIMIRWRTVPEIWCVTDVIVISHSGLFFALLPP